MDFGDNLESLYNEECAICLEDEGNSFLSSLSCDHRFHGECISGLVKSGHNKCPICRRKFSISEPDESIYPHIDLSISEPDESIYPYIDLSMSERVWMQTLIDFIFNGVDTYEEQPTYNYQVNESRNISATPESEIIRDGLTNEVINDIENVIRLTSSNPEAAYQALIYNGWNVDNAISNISRYPSDRRNRSFNEIVRNIRSDIELVVSQTGMPFETCLNSLKNNSFDIVNAIMELTL